jgi:hypothetical protein
MEYLFVSMIAIAVIGSALCVIGWIVEKVMED